MLAFWAAQRERQQAGRRDRHRPGGRHRHDRERGRGGVVETGDLGLSLFIWSVIALGLSLCAFSPRARAQRAAELQERAHWLERDREERTRAAVAAERARIARDLHDVIAHSVSVMTVQGGAARLLLDSDDRVPREPLLVVEETGRQAWPRCAACSASCTASRGAIRRSRPGPAWRSRPTLPGEGGGRPPTGRTASEGDGRRAGSGVP
jgi:hypothetical protein